MDAAAYNQAILERCNSLGLSLVQVQKLAASAYPASDPLHVLGLDPLTLRPLRPRSWLWMAAQTCSVSYRHAITPEGLLEVLTTGVIPSTITSPVLHFLEEAPLQIVVMAVEQAAQQSDVAISRIWKHLGQVAEACSSTRLGAITLAE